MAISRSDRVRQQLYGKEEAGISVSAQQLNSLTQKSTPTKSSIDHHFLQKDLFKIIIVATILIAIQFVLKMTILQ